MVYMVRHGQTDWNTQNRRQGQHDILLNEIGRRQAEELAKRINDLKIDKIYTSDLSRAIETAEIINRELNKEIIIDRRIREFDFGTVDGMFKDEITPEIRYNLEFHPEKYGAEPKYEIFKRVKSFFDELKEQNGYYLIVSHGGTLHMIMYYLLNDKDYDENLYSEKIKKIKVNNADIFEVDLLQKTVKIYG